MADWIAIIFVRVLPCTINLASFSIIICFLTITFTKTHIVSHYNLFCVLLASSDLSISIIGFCFSSGFLRYIDKDWSYIGESLILMVTGLTSLNLHVAIALDRLRSVTGRMVLHGGPQQQRMLSRSWLLKTLPPVYVSAVVWTVLPFVARRPSFREIPKNERFKAWSLDFGDTRLLSRLYIGGFLFFEYIVPIVLILSSYSFILYKVCKQKRSAHSSLRSQKVTIISFVSTLAFTLAWTPYASVAILALFGHGSSPVMLHVSYIMAKNSCFGNSLMFLLGDDKMRGQLVEIIEKKSGRRISRRPKRAAAATTTDDDGSQSLQGQSYTCSHVPGKRCDSCSSAINVTPAHPSKPKCSNNSSRSHSKSKTTKTSLSVEHKYKRPASRTASDQKSNQMDKPDNAETNV